MKGVRIENKLTCNHLLSNPLQQTKP